MPKQLSQEFLKSILHYDEETGLFTWLVNRHSNKVAGAIAGSPKDGYLVIHIERQNHRAHILAWLYVYGEYPQEIDHKDRDKTNNQLANLRQTTRSLNAQNRNPQSRNTSGVAGVSFSKRSKKWISQITSHGKSYYLGSFHDLDKAVSARLAAETNLKFGVHDA